MQYIIMALVGLVVGAIARLLYPGHQSMGWFATIILGIAGSYFAGFVSKLIHRNDDGQLHPAGFIYSIGGALALIFIAHNLLHIM
jgi:uncharacterized membrane protein YeaQ/YmgE (transglycosylase-associated protein family)